MTPLPAARRESVVSLAAEDMSCWRETHSQEEPYMKDSFSHRKVASHAGPSKDARFSFEYWELLLSISV